MAQEFPLEARARLYSSEVTHLAQQMMTRLRMCCREETVTGAEAAKFDQLQPSALKARMGRHEPTDWQDPVGDARWVFPNPFDEAFQLDKPDKVRMLSDPSSEYVTNMAMAAGRTMDDIIIAKFDAASTSGPQAAGSVAYDTSMDIAVGGTGMTFDKTLQASEKLNAVEESEMMRYIVFGSRQQRDILDLPEFTSADFNTMRALQAGQLTGGFMGFEDWIRSERLPITGVGGTRTTFFWQKSAMLFGVAEEGNATIDRLPEHRNSIGVQYQLDMGAVRMRETGVGRIFCSEA